MSADIFVESLLKIIPLREELNGYPKVFVDKFLNSYSVKSINGSYIRTGSSLIDLINNYDVSSLEVAMMRFNEKIIDIGGFITFGNHDAFPLAIKKDTNEIVELDWNNLNYIVSYCSINGESFLSSLIEVKKFFFLILKDQISTQNLSLEIQRISRLAGGNKYLNFYQQILE